MMCCGRKWLVIALALAYAIRCMAATEEGTVRSALLARRPIRGDLLVLPTSVRSEIADSLEMKPAIYWQALHTRDSRFDGRFFIGTITTRGYCRPTCRIPFGKPDHLVWFASAAAAEAAGFHPCRRCRPDTLPGTPAWIGTSAVVSRALRLIAEGALDDADVNRLASRVGIGSRQLRRLFVQHLGASPIKVATTQRLHFARKLIDETDLPMTTVALSSGFNSLRQFNHAIRTSCGHSPTALRRRRGRSARVQSGSGLVLRLPYREPFNWSAMIAFLRPRATPGVEFVREGCYRRTIEVGDAAGVIDVRPDAAGPSLALLIDLPTNESLIQVVDRVRRTFDLGADPLQIETRLAGDSRLRTLVETRPGLRVPGAWDGFEVAVKAILGEGLMAIAANPPAERLVRAFGKPVATSFEGLTHLFPRPEVLANVDLAVAGIRGKNAATVRVLARAICAKALTFEASRTLEDTIARLCTISGVGESMAHYIAMRAFGEPDAFPCGQSAAGQSESDDGVSTSHAETARMAERWRPWRAYAAMHLWAASATV
jgi:AraC family transcriptional regulator, regulatory protein of adaptative response / DNA-3-methyladenine glycosylase II